MEGGWNGRQEDWKDCRRKGWKEVRKEEGVGTKEGETERGKVEGKKDRKE